MNNFWSKLCICITRFHSFCGDKLASKNTPFFLCSIVSILSTFTVVSIGSMSLTLP